MNKTELIDRMCESGGMSKKYASAAADTMLKAIMEAMKRGESVALPGFGTFMVKERAERKGRNPYTGKDIIVPAKKVAVFKPGSALKGAVEFGSTMAK